MGVFLVLALAGACARRALARDVLPDLSDPVIAVVGDWAGHPAVEVDAAMTRELTGAFQDIPGATSVRGSSTPGMAYVEVVFDSAAHLAEGRRAMLAQMDRLRPALPPDARVQVGPTASSAGWVLEYVLVDPGHRVSTLTLGRLQDTLLRPALSKLAGVAEIASVGAGVQQVVLAVRPDRLRARGVAFSDVVTTVRAALDSGRKLAVQELLALRLAVTTARGDSPSLHEIADARVEDDVPSGLADLDGELPAVGAIVVATADADPSTVAERAAATLDRLRGALPAGVELVVVYDRHALCARVDGTLVRALAEEVAVVALVVLLALVHGRSALVPLVTLPVVLLLTFGAMWLLRLPATLMSFGGIGIALGMAVDADVVALEACHRRLEEPGAASSSAGRRGALVAAASAFTPAILTSLVITALAFLPVFAFTGETGRLLRPLAATKTLVITSAALVTLTLAPALRDLLLRGRVRTELENPLTRWLLRAYRPLVHFALARPVFTLATAALAVASCLPLLPGLGREFLPHIDEGDLLFMPTTMQGVSPELAHAQVEWQDRVIASFAEVASVFGKVGRAGTATDPAPYAMAETTVRLRPRTEWPNRTRTRWYSSWAAPALRALLRRVWPDEAPSTTPELIARLDEATRLPGWTSAWTAPVRARIDMMSTGVRTPVAVRVVAPTPERIDVLGTAVRDVLAHLPGTRSAVYESFGGETRVVFAADPAAVALHQVDPALLRSTVERLTTGGQVGEITQGGEVLRVRVLPNLRESMRGVLDELRDATVRPSRDPSQGPVPLALLGRASFAVLPAALRSELGALVGYVYVDLSAGEDIARYIDRCARALEHAKGSGELALAQGERLEWAGEYELMAAGEQRLRWIVPLVLASMLGLLVLQFRSLTEALIVLVSVPFALVGSVWALFLAGYPLSAPVWVGLLSVLGLAMQTGVVMVVYIDEAFHRRVAEGRVTSRADIVAAHAEGTVARLRPKLMTIATMAAGLMPLLWADGAGSEVMRRVAVPMIGGLATSAFLTLEVLPVLYTLWRHRQLLRAQRAGVPIATVIGAVPSWARAGGPRVAAGADGRPGLT